MIGIHQSQFLSWIPYFYKILKSDKFVVLDDVQFQKNGVQNRNQIKTPQGTIWLTIPVKSKLGISINEVEVSNVKVYDKLLKTIELNYKKSPYYNQVYPKIESAFNKKHKYLHKINSELLDESLKFIRIESNIECSSGLSTTQLKDDLVIEIIKSLKDDEYLSGKGALGYMDLDKFKKQNIKVYVYDFNYSEYPQLWNKRQRFISNLSIIDLLFNFLENARDYILTNGRLERII